MAFRGQIDKLFASNNGNFLGLIVLGMLVEMIARFDPVLKKHMEKISSQEIHDHYLGKDTQNEFIALLGTTVRDKIYLRISSAKYFALILDCTPDTSRQEQLSFVIRFVDMETEDVRVEECFLDFIPVKIGRM